LAPPSDLYLRCTLCERGHLQDADLRRIIKAVYSSNGLRLPFMRRPDDVAEERARWEVAMAMHAFDRLGVLSGTPRVLVVAPDSGPAVRWLTPQAQAVRDLPAPPAGLELEEQDGSFGVIHCARAFEGLADLEEASKFARELHRVLRPGGVAAISAGFRLEGPAPGPQGMLLLDEPDLRDSILGDEVTWAIASPLHLAAETPVVERIDPHVWTSVHLLLIKPLFH
jgi:SAM-dependent methyltransferase